MVALIVLGGVLSLLVAMLANDVLVYQDFPVDQTNWIPMGFLIAAIGSLIALIVLG
jgi:hypothetical protein